MYKHVGNTNVLEKNFQLISFISLVLTFITLTFFDTLWYSLYIRVMTSAYV